MERETRVAVFESESPQEIQLVKSKLDVQNIESFLNDKYMSFTTTPTASTVRLMVNLTDEKKSLEIIDQFLRDSDLDFSSNQNN